MSLSKYIQEMDANMDAACEEMAGLKAEVAELKALLAEWERQIAQQHKSSHKINLAHSKNETNCEQ